MMKNQTVEILLVEDNPGDVELWREALDALDVDPSMRVVGDAEQALDFLRPPDRRNAALQTQLIVLDLNLPGMHGLEFLAELKRDQRLRRLPVLVMSSSRAEEDIAASYSRQCAAYVPKPESFDALLDVVQDISDFWLQAVEYAPLPHSSGC